jgi:tryptophan synthase beta chain
MEIFKGSVVPSPSVLTAAGRSVLAANPNSMGSLAIAISEAVEDAASRNDTNYALGSVLNHVLLHQTVIGLEAKAQFEKVGDYPDVVVACNGGGSNFGGISFPFVADRFKGNKVRVVAVEPSACPTLTRGVFAYDYGDLAKLTPIMKMYTLGHEFMPAGIHAGGLRYHGDSPLVSALYHHGHIEARSYNQKEVFEAAILFSQTEGIVPAPESSHAIKGAIDEAIAAREDGKSRTILFGLSGHGLLDLGAYDNYLAGKLVDAPCPQEELVENLQCLPKV